MELHKQRMRKKLKFREWLTIVVILGMLLSLIISTMLSAA